MNTLQVNIELILLTGPTLYAITVRYTLSFLTNKPNSPNVQMNLTYLFMMNCAIYASLTKVKFKPKQSQFAFLRQVFSFVSFFEPVYLIYYRIIDI